MDTLMMKEATFDTGKVVLNYAEGPDNGPPLVMLHGGSARWQYFDSIIPELASDWHLFIPDLRGHGLSGRVKWGYAIRDYTEDIQAFLHEVSGPAILFGHSLGGMIALMTASQDPEWVRAVIVGDSPLDKMYHQNLLGKRKEELRLWQSLAGGSHPVEEISAALKNDHLAARLYHQDPDVLGILLDDFDHAHEGYEMDTLLPSIQCPVLLLQADPEKGSAMSDAEVERALPLLTRSSHVLFPGLSHLLFVEDTQIVLKAIKEFLSHQPSICNTSSNGLRGAG